MGGKKNPKKQVPVRLDVTPDLERLEMVALKMTEIFEEMHKDAMGKGAAKKKSAKAHIGKVADVIRQTTKTRIQLIQADKTRPVDRIKVHKKSYINPELVKLMEETAAKHDIDMSMDGAEPDQPTEEQIN